MSEKVRCKRCYYGTMEWHAGWDAYCCDQCDHTQKALVGMPVDESPHGLTASSVMQAWNSVPSFTGVDRSQDMTPRPGSGFYPIRIRYGGNVSIHDGPGVFDIGDEPPLNQFDHAARWKALAKRLHKELRDAQGIVSMQCALLDEADGEKDRLRESLMRERMRNAKESPVSPLRVQARAAERGESAVAKAVAVKPKLIVYGGEDWSDF